MRLELATAEVSEAYIFFLLSARTAKKLSDFVAWWCFGEINLGDNWKIKNRKEEIDTKRKRDKSGKMRKSLSFLLLLGIIWHVENSSAFEGKKKIRRKYSKKRGSQCRCCLFYSWLLTKKIFICATDCLAHVEHRW